MARRSTSLLLPMLAGAVVGDGAALLFLRGPLRQAGVHLPFWMLLLALWAVILAHECGHLLGGRLAGFRFWLLLAGPLRVAREQGRVRVGLNRNVALWGGLAGALPQGTRDLRRRTALMVAGGPAASLAGGLALLAPSRLTSAPAAGLALMVFGALSLAIGLATLIPGRTSGFATDGARLLRLLRGGAEADQEVAIMALLALSQSGTRPRDYPAELLARARGASPDSMLGASGAYLHYSHLLDTRRIDDARAQLQVLLDTQEQRAPSSRPIVLLDAAWFAAHFDRDAARARDFLSRATGRMLSVPVTARPMIDAAIAIVEGDATAARDAMGRARAARATLTDAVALAVTAEMLAELEARLASLEGAGVPIAAD